MFIAFTIVINTVSLLEKEPCRYYMYTVMQWSGSSMGCNASDVLSREDDFAVGTWLL